MRHLLTLHFLRAPGGEGTNAPMKSICVYCGSNAGNKAIYAERAMALGDRIARDGMRLV